MILSTSHIINRVGTWNSDTKKSDNCLNCLNERITALDESIQSKEEGAYVHYEFANMPGNFLRIIPHTNVINVEMGIPHETIQDSQGLCFTCGHLGWGSVIGVSPESDIDYIMGLVIQGYEHYLREEVKIVCDEVIREQDVEIVRDSNTLVIRLPKVLGDLSGTTVIDVRFEGDRVSRFEMRRELPTNDNP